MNDGVDAGAEGEYVDFGVGGEESEGEGEVVDEVIVMEVEGMDGTRERMCDFVVSPLARVRTPRTRWAHPL